MGNGLRGNTVLITGATGFVGGRLVEKLLLSYEVKVKALVRNFGHAARIARFPLDMQGGSITDPEVVDHVVAGCDVVFHCAYDFHNAADNIEGARLLAEACLRHGVKRLVHVSSFVVYGHLPEGELTEAAPAQPSGWAYADTKLAVERELVRYSDERSLPLVVVQPVPIYGPFAPAWTVQTVRQLRTGRVVLPDDGAGLCNTVYIDDVVDALILAAQKNEAIGESFLVSGPTPVTWREYYAKYEEILGMRSVTLVPGDELEKLVRRNSVTSRLQRIRRSPYALLNWGPIKKIYPYILPRLSESFVTRTKQMLSGSWYIPAEHMLDLYRSHCIIKTDKAQRVLGYKPQFSFERGMDLTGRYIKWANL